MAAAAVTAANTAAVASVMRTRFLIGSPCDR
jgi:hypothetical protein